ncbi:MAG: hypothetical protein RIS33_870 [Actinomycetota bacterium]|jgi:hypothetical protein
MKSIQQRPLVLLDVDGVLNDLKVLRGTPSEDHDYVPSHGYRLAVPKYMPGLIQWLCRVAEVHWCTTWRQRANDELAAHLGISALPVIDDGTNDRHVDWKARAAHDVAAQALRDGRRVLWIEDFYDDIPSDEMPEGVEFLDTAGYPEVNQVLDPFTLPAWLLALSDGQAA